MSQQTRNGLLALRILSSAVILLPWLNALSQGPGSVRTTELRVRVTYEDDRPVSNMIAVQLLSSQGLSLTESFTDDSGRVSFHGVRSGTYSLRAHGAGLDETSGPVFVINPREPLHVESLYVRRKATAPTEGSGQPTVHVTDLNVPRKAERAYEKGLAALRKDSLDEAKGLFEQALKDHPKYASAYNALGVVYMRQGRQPEGRAAFEKALTLDDHFALPYLNLGKMAMSENRVEEALANFSKCVANAPADPEALSRLAYTELLLGNFDEAVTNARKVHSGGPHGGFEATHLVAARALRRKQMRAEAIAEYKLFLTEAPASINSEQARREMSELENQTP